jgi:hypothetical protein
MFKLSIILSVFFIGAILYVLNISADKDKNQNYIPDSIEEAAEKAKKKIDKLKKKK